MDGIVGRILQLCDHLGMSINSFASSLGMNQVTLNNYKLGKRKPSLEVVEKVTQTYPQVSAEWLIRGIGNMLNGCGCSPSTITDQSFYHPSSDGTHNGLTTEEEGRKSESEQARFYKEQARFYKEQAEFYKQQLDSLKGRQ